MTTETRAVDSYPLRKTLAHYFTGPKSDEDYGYRTVPTLLRAVADWLDEHHVQDPEFEELVVKTVFGSNSDNFSVEYYMAATVYYVEKE